MKQKVYDQLAPKPLIKSQNWFAEVISSPIDYYNHINPVAPSGQSIAIEALDYILPSLALQPHERMEIYNQQFWWRLLSTLHDEFPVVVRLFGYEEFNQKIGFPYICKYLPNHYSLSHLGDRLADWLLEEYHEDDKDLVRHGAKVDWAFNMAFIEEHQSVQPLKEKSPDELFNTFLKLQPHVFLFEQPYDWFGFREQFLQKSVEHWLENPFPELKKGGNWQCIVFRNLNNRVTFEALTQEEYFLLKQLQAGSSIDQALDRLLGSSLTDTLLIEKELLNWTSSWFSKEWISLKRESKQDE